MVMLYFDFKLSTTPPPKSGIKRLSMSSGQRLAVCCCVLEPAISIYWGRIWPNPGVTIFTRTYNGKTLEISLYLAIKPKATKFCM